MGRRYEPLNRRATRDRGFEERRRHYGDGRPANLPMRMMAVVARPLGLAQGATQGFNLALVQVLLALKGFDHLEHFFHVVQSGLEIVDDPVDLVDDGLDVAGGIRTGRRSSRGGRKRLCWRHRLGGLCHRAGHVVVGLITIFGRFKIRVRLGLGTDRFGLRGS